MHAAVVRCPKHKLAQVVRVSEPLRIGQRTIDSGEQRVGDVLADQVVRLERPIAWLLKEELDGRAQDVGERA